MKASTPNADEKGFPVAGSKITVRVAVGVGSNVVGVAVGEVGAGVAVGGGGGVGAGVVGHGVIGAAVRGRGVGRASCAKPCSATVGVDPRLATNPMSSSSVLTTIQLRRTDIR